MREKPWEFDEIAMTINEQIRFSPQRVRSLIGVILFVVVAYALILGGQTLRTHESATREAQSRAERLSHIMADHVQLVFVGVDMLLRRAVEYQYFNALFGNQIPEYTEQNFRVWMDENPHVLALVEVAANGQVEVAANKKSLDGWLDYRRSLIGEAVLESLRNASDQDVYIGKWTTQKQQPIIVISRRFNRLDGEFAGVMFAVLDPEFFSNFYGTTITDEHKFMSVHLSDGATLAAGPDRSIANRTTAENALKDFSALNSKAQKPETSFSGIRREVDGNKMVAIARVPGYPLLATIVMNEGDYLSKSWASARKDGVILGLFVIFIATLSFLAMQMARQVIRVQESESAAILASQAKSEFLANMSHELRTPLNAIIGFSEMINSGYFGPLNAKQKERIHDITLCGTHLLQLISDILEFSKGDAGKLELTEEMVNVQEIIEECVRMMNGKFRSKALDCIVSADPQLPPILGDSRKIRQILLNLLSNSAKFTPEGGTIRLGAKLDQHNAMVISISDTGIGIAESDIPRALSIFGQVHRTSNNEGTGLGLPLCKMYAELHGGRLTLQSRLGEGTTVRIFFPHQRTLPPRKDKTTKTIKLDEKKAD